MSVPIEAAQSDEASAPGSLAARLRRLRRARLTGAEPLAAYVGIDLAELARWENGELEPNLVQIERIASHLRVAPEYLAFGIGDGELYRNVNTVSGPRPGQDMVEFAEVMGWLKPMNAVTFTRLCRDLFGAEGNRQLSRLTGLHRATIFGYFTAIAGVPLHISLLIHLLRHLRSDMSPPAT